MANRLTGAYDVVAEFSMEAVNRVLAAQHQAETYLHSIPADVPEEGLAWVRIDDAETGVRGIAQIQVSTPTVTLPEGENASRVTIHYWLMARIQADSDSAAVPEFVHGEIRATVGVPQGPWEDGDPIEVDLGAEDLEVVFTPAPNPDAPLSDEETARVSQIIRNVLRTSFEPVSSVVDLQGEALRVQQWLVKTMRGDERPAVALLVNLSDKKREADPADVTEVFLGEEDDFAIAIGRDFLELRLVDLMQKALPPSIEGTVELKDSILGITWAYGHCTATVDEVDVDLGEGRIQLSVDADVTGHGHILGIKWSRDGTLTVTQDFALIADKGRIWLVVRDDPRVELDVNLPGFAEGLIVNRIEEEVLAARGEILAGAQPLIQGLSAGFCDIFPSLRIPAPDVVYTAADIQAGGVIVRGTLDFGPWEDVVATFETKSTWPSQTPRPLLNIRSGLQDDLEQGVLSQEFETILAALQGFPPSDHPIITTEEEGRRWRIDDQGTTYIVIREDEELWINDPVDPDLIDYEVNALNSWIPGGTIQEFRLFRDGDEIAWTEHEFIMRFTEERWPRLGEEWCLQVSGVQGSPSEGVSGWSCGIGAQVDPRPVEEMGGGGFLVDVPDSDGDVVAHIDPWRPAAWSATLRPGGPGPRLSGGANLLVHFPGSESAQTWRILGEALARRKRKDAAVLIVAVVPPGLAIDALKLEANIAWARTEDAEQAWAKAFRVTATPATFMVNPQGKTVWQHAGRFDASAFITALDEHLVASGPLRWQQLRPRVRVGQPAPDFVFAYRQGRRIALRRLRRHPVVLNFWKSWSAPCLAELRHLQKLHERFAREGLVILAINDEEDSRRAQEVFEENGFTFAFVADASRQITELYGVNCWPTTVSLNEKGVVRHIQSGVTPGQKGPRVSRAATR